MSFFLFERNTAYEMLISYWSSDVCSSDLDQGPVRGRLPGRFRLDHRLLRLRLATAPRAPDASRQLCLRQSRGSRGAGRVSRRTTLQRARTGRDGGAPARRCGAHAVQGARADSPAARGGYTITTAPSQPPP